MAAPPAGTGSAMEQYLLEQVASLSSRLATAESSLASAQESVANAKVQREATMLDINAIWLVICGALGFFMQAGFAMLECGVVSRSNVINILFKNIVDFCVAGTVWWLWGFGLAYGKSAGGFIGKSNFAISNIYNGAHTDSSQYSLVRGHLV